jgi:hypothetical protein
MRKYLTVLMVISLFLASVSSEARKAIMGWTQADHSVTMPAAKNSENVLVNWHNPKLAEVYISYFKRNHRQATAYQL